MTFDITVRGYHFYRKYWKSYLLQKLAYDHEQENTFYQFAIKMSKNYRTFTPRNLETNKVPASQRNNNACRNIICEVQKFPFGKR